LVQDAFLQIWKALPGFRHEAKLSTWIYKITVNRALDHLRTQKDRRVPSFFSGETSSTSLDEQFSNRDLVSKGLSSLSEEHRTVLVLSMLHDLGNSEISAILDVSEGTIKSRLHYAKIEFRKFLLAHGVNV
jgi:RNA polymerase sigma-70 factor (ECF subfamily)